MKILVLGASGATGIWVVKHLLNSDKKVRIIVRSTEKLQSVLNHKNLEVIQGTLLQLSDDELKEHTKDCSAVISCLGHNLTFKGMYGEPRRLVCDAARRICSAIERVAPEEKVKYILMNTVGNRNRDLPEPIPFEQKVVIALLRLLLPPHVDNEMAADFLRTKIGRNHRYIEWSAVRPDGLIDEETVSSYNIHKSPTRSAIFNSGKTSRINVAHFMTELAISDSLWEKWKGQMPVIYNA